jgi:hypothetical protein
MLIDLLTPSACKDYKFIGELPIKLIVILWRRTLLSACRSRGAVDFFKRVFERILKLHDSLGGNHTLAHLICFQHVIDGDEVCSSKGYWYSLTQSLYPYTISCVQSGMVNLTNNLSISNTNGINFVPLFFVIWIIFILFVDCCVIPIW